MFEATKARILTAIATNANMIVLPRDYKAREVAEAMVIDGAPVAEVNKSSLALYLEQLRQVPEYASPYTPVAKVGEGPLTRLERRGR